MRMTNFARILNELNRSFSGRNEVVDKLCRYPLLIIDDFGMERGTEYALEQIYSIVDSRYRSRKPLIVTTNLTLDEIRHPQDPHFLHFQSVKKEKHRCVLLSAVLVSYFYVFNNSRSMRKLLQKSIVFLPEVSGIVHSVFSPEVLSIHFLRKLLAIQQSPSACEVRRVLFLIHRSRDAPADERFRFFFLHFLRFLFVIIIAKSVPAPTQAVPDD